MGTLLNAAAIVAGTLLGCLLRSRIRTTSTQTVMDGIALAVLGIGAAMALGKMNDPEAHEQFLYVIVSLVLGGLLGELLDLDGRLNRLGQWLEERLAGGEGEFARGFVTATLLFNVGAMAIMGSIRDGLGQGIDTLAAKSLLDGVTSVVLASTMGIGVAFSAPIILVYQGSITLAATWASRFLPTAIITEMTVVGGLLIVGIGLTMLGIKRVAVVNLLPSIAVVIILMKLVPWIQGIMA